MRRETVEFDQGWYLAYYPDVRSEVERGRWPCGWTHYLHLGAFEGRNPNPMFDELRYRGLYPDVRDAVAHGSIACGALHYVLSGAAEGRSPSDWFEAETYAARCPEALDAVNRGDSLTLWSHCVRHGVDHGIVPTRAFDTMRFRARYPEFCAGGEGSSFARFVRRGVLEWIEPPAEPEPAPERDARRALARRRLEGFLAGGRLLEVPSVERPGLSVILVVHNGADLLHDCVVALVNGLPPDSEIVMVDNASDDETRTLLARVRGARIFEQSSNLHFVRGANLGAEHARGEDLLFLNSDVEVVPGAIEAARTRLESDVRIGAVGAKLLGPESRILEFGCRFDASGRPYGVYRGEHVHDRRTRVAQSTAYCSGAFLLTRADVFREIGGFDPIFAPAYYEDADYCFRLGRKGLRTVVEPRALACHFEQGSSEPGPLLHILGRRNRIMFRARHREELERLAVRPALWPATSPVGGDDRSRILYIDDRYPLDRDGSGYPRARRVLEVFEELGHEVSMLFPAQPRDAPLPTDRDALCLRDPSSIGALLRERRPWFDTIWVSRPHNMRLLRDVITESPDLLTGLRLVYDAEAIYSDREAARPGISALPLGQVEANRRREMGVAVHADQVVCVSHREADKFRDAGWSTCLVTHHVDDIEEDTTRFDARRGMLVVAAVHAKDSPNHEGLRWFLNEVWPLIRKMVPDMTVTVAGAWALEDPLRVDDSGGIEWLGAVDDLRPLYRSARLFAAPIRYGAGIPLKVIESAAHGLPVCTTRAMAELLGWGDGELLLADAPEAFARASVELHECPELWERVRGRASGRVRQEFSRDLFVQGIQAALGGPEARAVEVSRPVRTEREMFETVSALQEVQ